MAANKTILFGIVQRIHAALAREAESQAFKRAVAASNPANEIPKRMGSAQHTEGMG